MITSIKKAEIETPDESWYRIHAEIERLEYQVKILKMQERDAWYIMVREHNKHLAPITPREQQVLNMVRGNLSNKEIASALHISKRTVVFHVSSLLQKCKVEKRSML